MNRQPTVAGTFYPRSRTALEAAVRGYLQTTHARVKALGALVPHAGYEYSGSVAGEVFATVEVPATVVILGVDHRGFSGSASLYAAGTWLTPLGTTEVDSPLAQAIAEEIEFADSRPEAHAQEHSIEVQVPFLQLARPGVKIVPLSLGYDSAREVKKVREVGLGLARAIEKLGRQDDVLVLASGDLSHEDDPAVTEKNDPQVIAKILELDEAGVLEVVRKNRISSCGHATAATMVAAAKARGARHAQLLTYTNSARVVGGLRAVGYAGIVVW